MISKLHPSELSGLKHRALIYIAYALLLHTLALVGSASSDATAAAASKQNLETLGTTPPQTLVDSGKPNFDAPNPATVLERSGDKFVDAREFHDENDNDNDDGDEEEIFHDASHEFEDDPIDGATEEIAELQSGLLNRLGDATKSIVAPAWEYYNLVVRFRKWRNEYNRLQVTYGAKPDGEPKLRDCLDVMRLEYAQVDRMLVDEMCRGDGQDVKPAQQYEMDFIWKVLKLLIERLESKLDELERAGPDAAGFASDYDEETRETLKQIEANASDRAKRIIVRSAAHLAKREFIRLVEVLLFDMVASYVANANQVDASGMTTLMGRIEPFVFLLGRANSPLLVSYMSNMKFRPVFHLVERYYSALSCPRPRATDSPQKSKPS